MTGLVPIEIEYEHGVPVKFSIDLRGLMLLSEPEPEPPIHLHWKGEDRSNCPQCCEEYGK